MEFTQEQAEAYFEQMNKSGELSDDELDNVAGGCGGGDDKKFGCPKCGSRFIKVEWYVGDQTYFVCRECGYSGEESTWYN